MSLDAHFHFEAKATPSERLRTFFGDELAERVMSGFIAALARDGLPSASRIAEAHCQGKLWPAEAAMICGVEELLRRGRPIDGIDRATLAAVYMAWQRAPETGRRDGGDIDKPLEEVLFGNDADREDHYRTSIEPQLAADVVHVDELYRLTTDPDLAGLAGRLAVDWLRRYPSLRCSTQKELLACALDRAEEEKVRALVLDRQSAVHHDLETKLLWLSADYVVNLENRRPALAAAAVEHPEFIWILRDRVVSNAGQGFDRFSLGHLAFVVESFGDHWRNVSRPTGTAWGRCNPSDASEFIRDIVFAIASRPEAEATVTLQGLIAGRASSYVDMMKHALALQLKGRRDFDYSAPTVGELRAAVTDDLPESIDQMRAWFADRLKEFRKRIRGSDTNMREAYWNDNGKPRDEGFCRDRLIEHVSGPLPESIRFGPELLMPGRKRADIALTRNAMKQPVEIKGQWERNGAYIDYLTGAGLTGVPGSAGAHSGPGGPFLPVMVGEGRPSTSFCGAGNEKQIVDGRPSPTMTGGSLGGFHARRDATASPAPIRARQPAVK